MSSLTYTGVYPTIVSATTTGGGGQAGMMVAGTTRWNATTNKMEVFDGYHWIPLSAGEVKGITIAEMVESLTDQIAVAVEEYADNVTIQDAFRAWEEANERFRVILAIAEKK